MAIDARTLQGTQTFSQNPGSWLGPPTTAFRGNVGDFTSASVSTMPTPSYLSNMFGPGVGGSTFGPMNSQPGLDPSKFNPTNTFGQPINQGAGTGGGSGGGSGGDQQAGGSDQKTEGKPDDRETERHIKRRRGDKDKELRTPKKVSDRVKSRNKGHSSKHLGIKSLDQEGGNNTSQNSDPASIPDAQAPNLGGLPKDIAAIVPAMEQLLQSIPNQLLGTFLGQLPGPLQSLIPPNLIPGLGGTGAVSLNNLLSIAGGGAIGGIANELFRSVLPAIGIPPQAIQALSPAIINQLGAGLGQATSWSALAQTMSSMQLASGVAARNGIPIDPAVLNQVMGTIIQANGLGNSIPVNLMGVAANLASNPLGSIVNAAMGGNSGAGVPVIPSNLSTPNASLLNGLGQSLPPELLQGLLGANQIASMLPQQLQALLPQAIGGLANNVISQFASSSPERVPGSNVGHGDQGTKKPKKKEAQNDGKDSKDVHDIDYAQMLSPNFNLFQLTQGAAVEPGNGKLYKDQTEVDEVIKNLSTLAVNVLEPIKEAFPFMQINAGFTPSGEHAKGKAVDIGFNVSPTRLMEIADWVRNNVPYKELQMNFQKKGWLHIVYDGSDGGGGGGSGGAVTTSGPAGVESGLVNRFG